MDSVKISNLSKRYDKIVAVDKISFSIKKGEIFGLLGPNGAGKSTTLLMLATLLKPSSGTATVNSFDIVKQAPQVRESIGIVFQDPSSDELLTGYENLKLHALLYDVKLNLIDEKINKVLGLVDLVKRKNDQVKKYSGGMRRRMEIARGLIHEPEILFLDEPTLGLDPQTRAKIWKYIETLAKKMNMTVILTTHYMEEAESLCDRVAIIDHGKIIALDSPANLIGKLKGDIVILSGKDVDKTALRKLKFVTKLETQGKDIRLSVENAAENLPALLQAAGKIDCVEVHPPSLNEVFLHYTGREIREDNETPQNW